MKETPSKVNAFIEDIERIQQAFSDKVDGYRNYLKNKKFRDRLYDMLMDIFNAGIPWRDRDLDKLKVDLNDPKGTEIIQPYFIKRQVLDIGGGEGRYWQGIRNELDTRNIINKLWVVDPNLFSQEMHKLPWSIFSRNAFKGPWSGMIHLQLTDFLISGRVRAYKKQFDAAVSVHYLSHLVVQASGADMFFNNTCLHIRNSLSTKGKLYFDSLMILFIKNSIHEFQMSIVGILSLLKPGGTLYIGPVPHALEVRTFIQRVLNPYRDPYDSGDDDIFRKAYGKFMLDVDLKPIVRRVAVSELRTYYPPYSDKEIARIVNGTFSSDRSEVLYTDLHIIITRIN